MTRTGGMAGIVFPLVLVAGVLTAKWPGGEDTNADVFRYLDDSGHRASQWIAGFLFAIAALLLVWFVAGLRERLLASGAEEREATIVTASGTLTSALLLVSAMATMAMAASYSFVDGGKGGASPASVGTLGWISGFSIELGVFGAAGLTLATAFVAMRTTAWPSWFAWAAMLAVLGCLTSVLFFPMVLWLLWVLAAGVLLLSPGGARTPAATSEVRSDRRASPA